MIMLYVASDRIGHGSDELGTILMSSYLNALTKGSPLPDVIVFVNSGVRLLAGSSPALKPLKELQAKGVKLLGCGTCLDYFELKDRIVVGEPTNAVAVTGLMLKADKVIKL